MKKDISKLNDEEITELFQDAVQTAIEKAKQDGKPICGYDDILHKSYILYSDGMKVYA